MLRAKPIFFCHQLDLKGYISMRYSEVCLESCGYFLPDKIITSDEIEAKLTQLYKTLQCPKGHLEALTGIKERRVWPSGTLPSDIATKAAKKTLLDANLKKDDIDLVIYTGVCRDKLEPSTANVVHHNLGLPLHCQAFDVSNACIGFLNGMIIASNMIEMNQIKTALVVTGENAGPLYDTVIPKLQKTTEAHNFRKYLASLTLGSAGVAMILRRKSLSETKHQVLGGITQTDSEGHHLCQGTGNVDSLEMETDTVNLMKKGLILSQKSWELFKRHLEWTNKTPDHVITHQISRNHQEKCLGLLGLPLEKGYSHISYLGNTGSAAAPLSLAQGIEKSCFHKKDMIALLGIGSGINTLMIGLRW